MEITYGHDFSNLILRNKKGPCQIFCNQGKFQGFYGFKHEGTTKRHCTWQPKLKQCLSWNLHASQTREFTFWGPARGGEGAPLEIVYRIFRSLDVCATSAVTDFYKRVEKRPIRPIFRVKILLYHGAVWTSETPKCTSMYSLSASLSSQYNEG